MQRTRRHTIAVVAIATALLAGCGGSSMTSDDVVEPDAAAPACDPTASFGAGTAVDGLTDAVGARFSPDERTVWYSKDGDLFEATRSSPTGSFGAGTALTSLNMVSADEFAPTVTADQLVMVFMSNRGGSYDLFLADREATDEPFFVVSWWVS